MLRPAALRAVALTSVTVATLAAFRSALLTSMSRLQSPHAHWLNPEPALARRVPAVGDPTSSSSSVAETIHDGQGISDIVSNTSSHSGGGSPTTSSSIETSSQTSTSSVGSPSLSNSTSATSTSSTMSSITFIDSFSSSSMTDSLTTTTIRTDDSLTQSSSTSFTETETSLTSSSSSTTFSDSFTTTSTTTTDTGDFTTSDTTVSPTTSRTETSTSSSTASSVSDTVTSTTSSDSETIHSATEDSSQTSLTDAASSTTLDSTFVLSDSATSPRQETSSDTSQTTSGFTQLPWPSESNIPRPTPSSSDATISLSRPSAPPDETGIVFSQSGASNSGSPLPSVAAAGGGDGFWHNPGAVAGVFIPLAFAIGGLVFFIGKYLNNRKQNARTTPYHAVPGGNSSGSGLDMENRPFIPAAPISPFYYDPYTDNDATLHSQPVASSDQPWQRYSDDPRPLGRSDTVFSNSSVYSQEGATSPTDPVLGHEHVQGTGAHSGDGQSTSVGLDGLSNSNPSGAGGGASQGHVPNMGGSMPTAPNAGGLGGGYNAPVPTHSHGASPYLPVIAPPLGYLSTHVEESEPESDDEEQIGGGPPLRIRNRRRFDENSCIDEPARARLLQEPEP